MQFECHSMKIISRERERERERKREREREREMDFLTKIKWFSITLRARTHEREPILEGPVTH